MRVIEQLNEDIPHGLILIWHHYLVGRLIERLCNGHPVYIVWYLLRFSLTLESISSHFIDLFQVQVLQNVSDCDVGVAAFNFAALIDPIDQTVIPLQSVELALDYILTTVQRQVV